MTQLVEISAEAQRQTELLNQQVAALRMQLGDLQALLDDGTVDRLYRDAVGTDFQAVRARAAAALIRD